VQEPPALPQLIGGGVGGGGGGVEGFDGSGVEGFDGVVEELDVVGLVEALDVVGLVEIDEFDGVVEALDVVGLVEIDEVVEVLSFLRAIDSLDCLSIKPHTNMVPIPITNKTNIIATIFFMSD